VNRLDKNYLIELELASLFELRALKASPKEAVAQSSPNKNASPSLEGEAPKLSLNPNTSATRLSVAGKHRTIDASVVIDAAPALRDADASSNARNVKIANLSWDELAKDVATCKACGLCSERRQVVVGEGAKTATWLFIGEAPATEEDAVGLPFVGQAGKLLDEMLIASELARDKDVYLVNAVKCRPPGNRTPTVEEVAACAPYLDRQISLLAPKIIVALGKTAISRLHLGNTGETMANLRGKRHHYREIPVVATYHPAYLLLKLPEKLKAWEDLMFAKDEYGKTIA